MIYITASVLLVHCFILYIIKCHWHNNDSHFSLPNELGNNISITGVS